MIYNERGLNTLHFCLDTPITFIPQQSSISYNTLQQHSTEVTYDPIQSAVTMIVLLVILICDG